MITKKRAKELVNKWKAINNNYGCVLLSDGRYYHHHCAKMIKRFKTISKKDIFSG